MFANVRVVGLATMFLGLMIASQSEASETVSKSGNNQTPAKPKSAVQPKTAKRASPTIATVNGHAMTEDDLRFMMLSRGAKQATPELRNELLDRLIDRALVRQFLASRKTEADPKQLEDAVAQLKRQLRDSGRDPDAVLDELGYDEARVREDLALTLAWQAHMRKIVTSAEIEEYFTSHRVELDGTEVRASQILVKLPESPADADVARAKAVLEKLREQIDSESVSFAEAAKQHSDAPSRENGGDVGWFPYRGRMPTEISSIAFGLKKDVVSAPFRTRFGIHILKVTDLKPGTLSLEDARPEILRALSDNQWDRVVTQERSKAKISRK
jgi:peptidyl-prolyl cis-trans isomerase C